MKPATVILTALAALVASSTALAQGGPLTPPPGPPAPTMKSLDEIEPRHPISALPYTINQPGSYYLTGNLTMNQAGNALTVGNDNVSLDLNGFSLTGQGAGMGIVLDGVRNVTVRNGSISGFDTGVDVRRGSQNIEILHVRTSGGSNGFLVTDSSPLQKTQNILFERCSARAATRGLYALINNASEDGGVDTLKIRRCAFHENGMGVSLLSSSMTTNLEISNSTFVANTNNGIRMESGDNQGGYNNVKIIRNQFVGRSIFVSVISGPFQNAFIRDNQIAEAINGISLNLHTEHAHAVEILSNQISGTNGTFIGIRLVGAKNVTVDGNRVSNFATGISLDAASTRNLIIRNDCRDNGTNYALSAGNNLGPIIDLGSSDILPSGTSPFANFQLSAP